MLSGLVYLPDPETSALCVEYANEVTEAGGSRSSLGPGGIPHVSLIHTNADIDPEVAWKEAAASVPPTVRMNTSGLVIQPYPRTYNGPDDEGPGVLSWLLVIPSEDLLGARAKAMELSWVKAGQKLNSGPAFQPHLTLGISDAYPNPVSLPPEILTRIGIHGRLALGRIGKHGVFQEVYSVSESLLKCL